MAQALTLEDAQIKRVQRYLKTRKHSVRDCTIFAFAFNTGLRAKELAALCVGDVYDAQLAVRDRFTLQRHHTKGARTRTVFVNQSLKHTLDHYTAYLLNPHPSAPLFASQKGGHFSANTMCQLFLTVFADCGLKGASSHTPRRTFITRLANKGIGVRVLAELAGHSSIAVTQRYIDVNDTQLAQAVELV
jgi:integrase/recombinase XerD